MNKRILQIYTRLLEIHIGTKTVCTPFHKDTEKAYETAFEVLHGIAEINQDLEIDTPIMVEDVSQEVYTLLGELKSIIETEVKSNKEISKDNLLRGLSENIVGIRGTMRGYMEQKDEKEKSQIPMKKVGIKPY